MVLRTGRLESWMREGRKSACLLPFRDLAANPPKTGKLRPSPERKKARKILGMIG